MLTLDNMKSKIDSDRQVFTVSLYKLRENLNIWLFIFHSDTQTAIHIQWNPNNKRFKLLTANYYLWLGSCNNKMQNLDSSTKFLSEMQVQQVHNGAVCTQTHDICCRWIWRTHWAGLVDIQGAGWPLNITYTSVLVLPAQFVDKWDEEIKSCLDDKKIFNLLFKKRGL